MDQNFGVGHYAGPVFYDVEGFVEKNRDTLNPEVAVTMCSSGLALIKEIFKETIEKKTVNTRTSKLSSPTLVA